MLIDSTNLIQVLDHNDGLVPVATLSGPMGDLTIQGPSGVVNIPSVFTAPSMAVTAASSTALRSLANRFAELVNVKDYGAAGDGVSDDTSSLVNAAAVVNVHGGVLYFPPGNYLVSGLVPIADNVTIFAQRGTAYVVSAPAANWGVGGITSVFYNAAVNTNTWAVPNPGNSNIAVVGMGFTFPHGSSLYGGGACHIMSWLGVTNLTIRDCISDGGGDFSAMLGCVTTKCTGNVITNVSNAGLDHWNGTTDSSCVDNTITTLPTAGNGCGAIQFTGLATGGSASTTTGLICTGNILHVQHTNGQAIEINGHASSGADDKVIISHNKIVVDNTVTSWGILVTGIANHGIVSDNYIEGGDGEAAIGIFSPGTYWTVSGNHVNGWVSNVNGTIQVTAPHSAVFGNTGAGCTGGPFIGTYDSTSLVFGNDTGTGGLTLDKATLTNAVSASFSGTVTAGGFTTVSGTVATANLTATGNPAFGWNGAGGATVSVNAATSQSKNLEFMTAGTARWFVSSTSTAESGSNVGSDFTITACADAGSVLTTPLKVTRSTGTVALGNAAAADVITGKGSAGTTTQTAGFLMIPFVAGAPTGVPTNAAQGVALVYDTTNHKLWAYDNGASAWKGVALT